LAICEGAKANKVKRLVLTSSVVSIASKKAYQEKYTPDDWSDVCVTEGYSKSKTLAEKAAWDFQSTCPDDCKFELSVINPGLIFGKPIITNNFSSADIINAMLSGKMTHIPPMSIGLIDVVDCAKAHIRAIEVPEAANRRFILVENNYWFMDVAKWLKAKYPENKKISVKPMGCYCIFKCFSCCSKQAAMLVRMWDKPVSFDNSATKEVLGIEFKPAKESAEEMADFIVDSGYIGTKM